MASFRRPFLDLNLIDLFFTDALEMPNFREEIGVDLGDKILLAEKGIDEFEITGQTLDSDVLRNEEFKLDDDRWILREMISAELCEQTRLDNDDEIQLGLGGALPQTPLLAQNEVFIVIGPPAAGKSTISNILSDEYGAVIVDSDYAKRKLPEFRENSFGATIVNKESSYIVRGFPDREAFTDLTSFCVRNGYNFVAPVIGGKPGKIFNQVNDLRDAGYKVHLVLVSASRQHSTLRAIRRFYDTGRYVPIGYVFDEVANDPAYCYYYLKNKYLASFESMGAVTLVDQKYFCIDATDGSPASQFDPIDLINELP